VAVKLGGVTLPSTSEAPLLAGWNFNDTNALATVSHGSGSLDTNNLVSVTSFGGIATNAYNGDEAGQAFAIARGTAPGNNTRYITFQLDMTDRNGLSLSYATRGTTNGFTTQAWSWSTDGISFTPFATISDRNVTTWSRQAVDFTSAGALNGAAEVYIRCTVDGATDTAGNNRFDNVLFHAHATQDLLVYQVTDGQLATVNAGNPLRFDFNVHDPSGIHRGTFNNGRNMAVTIEDFLTDNTDKYSAGDSDADTTIRPRSAPGSMTRPSATTPSAPSTAMARRCGRSPRPCTTWTTTGPMTPRPSPTSSWLPCG
jgi:hypothetical protein